MTSWGKKRGTGHSTTPLDEPLVYEIRERCDAGETFTKVTADFVQRGIKISVSCLSRVAKRQYWAWLPERPGSKYAGRIPVKYDFHNSV